MIDAPLLAIEWAAIRALSKVVLPRETWFVAHTIGTLTACKLLFRFHNEGSGTFSGKIWEELDRMSDVIAGDQAPLISKVAPKLVGIEHDAPGRFLRLVRTRTTFQWCPMTVPLEGPPPFSTDVLEEMAPFAYKVCLEIWKSLARRRARLRRSKNALAQENVFQLIGAGAAAKILLAIWGNGTVAAFLERCAEEGSEAAYQMLRETPKVQPIRGLPSRREE